MLSLFVVFASMAFGQVKDADWLTYGKNLSGWRYSELDQIKTTNVKSLALEWVFQTNILGKQETTPLVKGNVMYVTGPENSAFALDLTTGRQIWKYSKNMPPGVNACCGLVNRGFAMQGDVLFKVNIESTLVALDSKTGSVIWESTIDDYKKGYTATVAPIVVKDKVIIGIAGAEFGTRCFIDAYDVKTGKRVWRFWTVPGPGEFGGESWPKDGKAYERGGGSTWVTGTYDPELNLIYWGTGNPGPDMNGDVRPGDNLFTCSIVALDADTGQRKWHFQFTPHDVHDWDATEDPVLLDIDQNGKKVKAVVMANRNGFYYALDRATGKLLTGKPYTEVSWAKGLDANGRPILVPGQDPTPTGNKACPGGGGGHNWQPTAYSPQTNLYYFSSTDGCHTYYMTNQEYLEGQWYQASTFTGEGLFPKGSIVAVNPATGDVQWRWKMVSPPSGGMLATAGGLVFSGDSFGYFFALDAKTGKPLWNKQLGGTVINAPMTWARAGRQFVTVAAGGAFFTFALPK
ncbi:MAG: PQQ-dependent dehydrogenase, methanol/ethanol family [Candidatus Solibacter usitatus]|nr:PQQ-dependent dehydrogenase, methanol/ethanol family [Candidatus Solibacter usitatus]